MALTTREKNAVRDLAKQVNGGLVACNTAKSLEDKGLACRWFKHHRTGWGNKKLSGTMMFCTLTTRGRATAKKL